MPEPRLRSLIRAVGASAPADGLPDAELIARFAAARDEAAFELLVWRHGPMVRAVCRRVLGDPHAADDAFQATFLVLARRAGSIRAGAAVGAWLHRVAERAARRLRRQLAREQPGSGGLSMVAARDEGAVPPDTRAALDDEVGRLPEKYRLVVHLCYLAGYSTAEAAARLGWAKGTVLTRLAWARRRLRDRLTRRGIGLGGGSVAAALGPGAAELNADLVRATVRAAVAFAGGGLPAGVIPTRTSTLTEGVLRAMTWDKIKLTAGLLVLAAGSAGVGAGKWLAAQPDGGGQERRSAAVAPRGPARTSPTADDPARPEPPPTRPAEPSPNPPSIPGAPSATPPDPRPVTPDLAEPATSVSSPTLLPPTPVPETRPEPAGGGRQLVVSRPVGTWYQDVAGHRFTLKFEEDRLVTTTVVDHPDGPVTVTVEADYGVGKDSVVFGYVTGITCSPSEASVDLQDAYVDVPFSFRFRADGQTLSVKNVKVVRPEGGADDLVLFVPGRYGTNPPPRPSEPRANTSPSLPPPPSTSGRTAPPRAPGPGGAPSRLEAPIPTPAGETRPSVELTPAGPDPLPSDTPQLTPTPPVGSTVPSIQEVPTAPNPGPADSLPRQSQTRPEPGMVTEPARPRGQGRDPFRRPDGTSRLIPSIRPRGGVLPSLTPTDSAPQPVIPQT